MGYWLQDWNTGQRFGPASEESRALYEEAKGKGKPFFLYPYHGYHLNMIVIHEVEYEKVNDS